MHVNHNFTDCQRHTTKLLLITKANLAKTDVLVGVQESTKLGCDIILSLAQLVEFVFVVTLVKVLVVKKELDYIGLHML